MRAKAARACRAAARRLGARAAHKRCRDCGRLVHRHAELGVERAERGGVHRGARRARREVEHAHRAVGELAAQRLAEAAQGELARAVGGVAGIAEVAEDRADVDDPCLGSRARRGRRRARAASARAGWPARSARARRRPAPSQAKSPAPALLMSRLTLGRCGEHAVAPLSVARSATSTRAPARGGGGLREAAGSRPTSSSSSRRGERCGERAAKAAARSRQHRAVAPFHAGSPRKRSA